MIRHSWSIICDRSEEDGIVCVSLGGLPAEAAEEFARSEGWISEDGYHECRRHPPKPSRSGPEEGE